MQAQTAQLRPERYRNYLLVLARMQLRSSDMLRGKISASDIVQEALMKAHESLPKFRGATEAEMLAWLRAILATKFADSVKHFLRRKRDAALEESIRETLDGSAVRLKELASKQSSPSQHVLRREREAILAETLEALPEDQATAISLRYLAGCSVEEVAAAMQRSGPAVAGLLRRGLKELRERLRNLE